jgi:hypothetical protein
MRALHIILTLSILGGITAPVAAGEGTHLNAMLPATLATVKERLGKGDQTLQPAMDALLKEASKALKVPLASVMDKVEAFPGADKHDYVSYAPYFWPNPDTKDGLPFVRHDGKRNREQTAKGDSPQFGRMLNAVNVLSLTYGLTGDERYAVHAAALLKTWFVDPATRMNPNFTHAQAVLGVNTGRGTGLIEFNSMPHLVDGLTLLKPSKSWPAEEQLVMHDWLTQYAHWLATSKEAAAERAASNNHGSWFDVHEASLLIYLGKVDDARVICEKAKTRRIARQIEPDGHQPLEESRADGYGYSVFNINALFALASLSERVDVDLWGFETADGRSIKKAISFLARFTDPAVPWPHNQMNALNRAALLPALLQATWVYGDDAFGPALRRLGADEIAASRLHLLTGK